MVKLEDINPRKGFESVMDAFFGTGDATTESGKVVENARKVVETTGDAVAETGLGVVGKVFDVANNIIGPKAFERD